MKLRQLLQERSRNNLQALDTLKKKKTSWYCNPRTVRTRSPRNLEQGPLKTTLSHTHCVQLLDLRPKAIIKAEGFFRLKQKLTEKTQLHLSIS